MSVDPGYGVSVSDGSYNAKSSPSGAILFLNIVNSITHLLLGAAACCAYFFTLIFTMVPPSLPQHIILCTTGYVILMSLAVLSLSPHSGWTSGLKQSQKNTIHWVMQILGSALAIAGSIIRIVDVDFHFESTHSYFGILALAFLCLSLIGGIVNLNITSNKTFIKTCHACLGTITILMAYLALIFGFWKLNLFQGAVNFAITVTALAWIGTVLSATISSFRRICR